MDVADLDLGYTTMVGAEGMYEARCRRCFEPNLAAAESQKKKKAELAATPK